MGMPERSDWMKVKLLIALLGAVALIPCVAHAGVLENADLDDYQYQTFDQGGMPLTGGTIYSESVQSNFCVEGCILKLLKTGQTITMQPDDYIVINDGVMKRKND
jgi:hypothetical protein